MTKMDKMTSFSRRGVLKAGGAVVVSVGMPIGLETVIGVTEAAAQGGKPPLTPDQLSSFIAVNADGSVSAFFGKMDMGQGLFVAIGQIVAEELDVPFNRVNVIMGDTATSVNQGGASGSTGIQFGGKQMRMAAAEARRVLVEMAAQKLGVPADQLTVTDGVVHATSDPVRKASYAELIGGRYFNVTSSSTGTSNTATRSMRPARRRRSRTPRTGSSASRSSARMWPRRSSVRRISAPT